MSLRRSWFAVGIVAVLAMSMSAAAQNVCVPTPGHTTDPTYSWYIDSGPDTLPAYISEDLELFLSDSFDETGPGAVTGEEAQALLTEFHFDYDNVVGANETDMQLVFNYLSYFGTYDAYASPRFELHPACTEIDIMERGHLDLYLTRGDVDALWGTIGSQRDPEEDEPRDDPDVDEYNWNSMNASDTNGNINQNPDWPAKACQGFSHEFGHIMWRSNRKSLGCIYEGSAMDEQFACAAAQLVTTDTGPPLGSEGDIAYGQSLIDYFGQYCVYANPTSPTCEDSYDWEDCRVRYPQWTAWAAYLLTRFHDTNDYSNDLVYRWARATFDAQGRLTRDMCGLARTLDDPYYDYLGGDGEHPGEYRLARIFSDYSVAKWVDDPTLDSAYSMGGYWSPAYNGGFFQKRDMGMGAQYHNAWEISVPPKFVIGQEHEGTVWSVPGNASDPLDTDCTDGWNDPTNNDFCGNDYCQPVKVSLWGTDYIVFLADTNYYSSSDGKYLRTVFQWDPESMDPGTELWINVLRYPTARDDLYDYGNELAQVETHVYGPGSSTAAFNTHYFGDGGTEAVVIVLTVVETDFDNSSTMQDQCGAPPSSSFTKPACMQRTEDYPRDLTYSYSFVVQGTGSSGCPFVSVGTEDGYVVDNNILAGGAGTKDVLDRYLLETDPDAGSGRIDLRIREDERERSQIDRVGLVAVDCSEGQRVAVMSDGLLRQYRPIGSPLTSSDETRADLTRLVTERDGNVAVLCEGSWVDVEFTVPEEVEDVGIAMFRKPAQKVDYPHGSPQPTEPDVYDLTPACYRLNPSEYVLDVPEDAIESGGTLSARFVAPVEMDLDEIFLVELSDAPVQETACEMLSAVHSSSGDCAASLSESDSDGAELVPGELIDVRFSVPQERPGFTRRYVFESFGRYEPYETGEPASEWSGSTVTTSASPNPFNPYTEIHFELPADGGWTSVKVYSMDGRLVRELVDSELPAGTHTAVWNGRDENGARVASGVYFYRVEAPGVSAQQKLVLVK